MIAYPAITPGLTYNDEDHLYAYMGRSIPNVTGLIQAAGLVEGLEWMTDEHRKRGSAVHAAVNYLTEDDLAWETVDPAIGGYLRAAQKFWSEMKPVIPWAETPIAHPTFKYGCTPDVPVCFMGGEPLLLDYKSGAYQASHAVQLAANVEAVKANAAHFGLKPCEVPQRGISVQLCADGSYKIHDPRTERKPITHLQAWAMFLACLNLYYWKEKYCNANANLADNDLD